MSHFIQKTYYTTCPGDLKDNINANATVTTELLQIVYDGVSESFFEFVSEPPAGEITELDNILATFTCPVDNTALVDTQDFSDDEPADPNVIWSSDKIEITFTPLERSINGVLSLTGGGDLTADRNISLVNDAASPGSSKLYGTNSSGIKGWYDQPTGGNTGLVGALHQMVFNEYGTANNEWLELYGNSRFSNYSPGIMPFQSKLVAVTWTSKTVGGDTTIKVYSTPEGGGTSPKILDFEWTLVNKRVARKTNFGADIIFDAGDKVAVYVQDTGTNVKDVNFVMYFQIITDNSEEGSEDYSGYYSVSSGGGSD